MTCVVDKQKSGSGSSDVDSLSSIASGIYPVFIAGSYGLPETPFTRRRKKVFESNRFAGESQ